MCTRCPRADEEHLGVRSVGCRLRLKICAISCRAEPPKCSGSNPRGRADIQRRHGLSRARAVLFCKAALCARIEPMAISERKLLQRELARHLKEQDRAKLAELRARIHSARVNRRAAVTAARSLCRSARVDLRDRQRLERERLRDEQRSARASGRSVCETNKSTARVRGLEHEAAVRGELREERSLQRDVRHAEGRLKIRRSSARERAQESDDAVRHNLPAELVPVFDAVKSRIKPGPRRSRTEAFLEWAEENPDEIVSIQQVQADQDLATLLEQEKTHYREMRKTKRYRQEAAELRKALAGVPF